MAKMYTIMQLFLKKRLVRVLQFHSLKLHDCHGDLEVRVLEVEGACLGLRT